MKSCDVDTILARTQVLIVLILLGIFALLIVGLMGILVFSHQLSLPDSVVTTIAGLVSDMKVTLGTLLPMAVGYFVARQRHKTANDDDEPSTPTSPAAPATPNP